MGKHSADEEQPQTPAANPLATMLNEAMAQIAAVRAKIKTFDTIREIAFRTDLTPSDAIREIRDLYTRFDQAIQAKPDTTKAGRPDELTAP